MCRMISFFNCPEIFALLRIVETIHFHFGQDQNELKFSWNRKGRRMIHLGTAKILIIMRSYASAIKRFIVSFYLAPQSADINHLVIDVVVVCTTIAPQKMVHPHTKLAGGIITIQRALASRF